MIVPANKTELGEETSTPATALRLNLAMAMNSLAIEFQLATKIPPASVLLALLLLARIFTYLLRLDSTILY